MVTARLVLAIAAQAAVAGVFLLCGKAKPWVTVAPWWTVYGTLIDVGCLVALAHCMRREGGRWTDLVDMTAGRLRRDILVGLAYAAGILPFGILGGFIGSALIDGLAPAPMPIGPLPLPGALYCLLIWPAVWAVAERIRKARNEARVVFVLGMS